MRAAILMTAMAVALSFGTQSAEASTKLTKNFWVYTGTKYRRGGAEGAMLGSSGIVRKTFLKAFDYERKELFTRDLLGEGVKLKFRKGRRGHAREGPLRGLRNGRRRILRNDESSL